MVFWQLSLNQKLQKANERLGRLRFSLVSNKKTGEK